MDAVYKFCREYKVLKQKRGLSIDYTLKEWRSFETVVVYLNYDIRMERTAFERSIKDYKLENYGWILQFEYAHQKMNKTKYTDFDVFLQLYILNNNCKQSILTC